MEKITIEKGVEILKFEIATNSINTTANRKYKNFKKKKKKEKFKLNFFFKKK